MPPGCGTLDDKAVHAIGLPRQDQGERGGADDRHELGARERRQARAEDVRGAEVDSEVILRLGPLDMDPQARVLVGRHEVEGRRNSARYAGADEDVVHLRQHRPIERR